MFSFDLVLTNYHEAIRGMRLNLQSKCIGMNSSFRTEIKISPFDNKLTYKDKVVLMGSCFADSIGQKLVERKFDVLVNPFGVIYNPISLSVLIERILNNRRFYETDFKYHEGRWNCFQLHGSYSGFNKEEVVERANQQLKVSHEMLKEAKWIILTLGTSIVYRKEGLVVANCHKVPQSQFEKSNLSIEEVELGINQILSNLRSSDVNANVILTISPIRHLSNGLQENSKSKARLLCAMDNVLGKKVHYFPSYEIMMDDLRDYRFYNKDLIHPSSLSVDYIWSLLTKNLMDEECHEYIKDVDRLNKMKTHRPINPESDGHLEFLKMVELFEKELLGRWGVEL